MDKKKRVVIQMEGGLGKQIALTSLIPYFHERYEQIVVFSSYPDVFTNNPKVWRSISFNTPYGYEEYFKDADDIVFPCGYRDTDFRKKRIHLIEAACNSINIKYDKELMKPELYLSNTEENIVHDTVQKLGNYIIIQAHGGYNPNTTNHQNVMAKDYNIYKMEQLVEQIHNKYPNLTILNYSLPKEIEIKGTIKADLYYPIWFGLAREAETFITIDSSLQHMSAAWNKKGIVLWGATDPNCFGWEHNINISNNKCSLNDKHCSRPYFVPSVDLKTNNVGWECPYKDCMDFDNDKILNELSNIEIKTDRMPSQEINGFMSMITKFGE